MVSKPEKDHNKRPWGEYKILLRSPGMWVKRTIVLPGKRLSLQKHFFREERWVIVEGKGRVILNNKRIGVKPGDCVTVGMGVIHRIENTGLTSLVFVEVALGKKLSEKDIERIEDDYGRV